MKKNQYTCDQCGHKINTINRDQGVTPFAIGCTKHGCEGIAKSSFFNVDQEIMPEIVWIDPKNVDEWKVIEEQLKTEIRMKFPKKKERKVEKMKNDLMFSIKDHVKQGGLVNIPVHIAEGLESYQT